MYTALARLSRRADHGRRPGRADPAAPRPRRAQGADPPAGAAAAGGADQLAVAERPAPLQEPRRPRDLAPLRRLEPVLRVGARPVDGLHLRRATRPRTPPWRRPRRPSSTWWPASSACSQGMRLLDVGCGWGGMVMHAAREYGVQALGRDAVPSSRPSWAQKAIAERGLSDLAEVRHLDYRDVHRDRLRRGQLDRPDRAHRQAQAARLLRVPATASCAPEGRLLNHCITRPDNTRAGDRQRRLHQPLRLPRRRAGAARATHLAHARRRLRGPARGEPPRALRQDPAPAGATTSTRTGTRPWPRSARARPGCGGCTWPAPGSASTATASSCTRCSASSSPTAACPACRCGRTGRSRP